MTVLIPVVHVRPAVVVQIFVCAFHPILKATALDFAAHSLAHVRATTVRLAHLPIELAHRLIMSAHKVRHALIVATAKAITVLLLLVARNPGIAVLIAVVHIWLAVIVEILARAFDPIAETLSLGFL
jgi:hypothetical protein